MSTQLNEHHHSFFALVIIIFAYMLGFAGVKGEGYGIAFVSVMGLSVVLRHIRYSVETIGLPVRLRRVSGSPYFIFLIIIFADFLSLVLTFALITSGHPPPDVTWVDLKSAAASLFQFRELIRLLTGAKLSVSQIMVGLAGLLFYLALLRILLRFKDFRRQDIDYHWLAQQQNTLGNFSSALRYLNKIRIRTTETDSIQLVSLLGVNQLDRAEEKTRLIIQQKGDEPTNDRVFITMMFACLLAPISERVIVSLASRSITSQIADVWLNDAIGLFALTSKNLAMTMADLLFPKKYNYPLSCATVFILTDNSSEASDLLEKATPGTELEEISRLTMQLRASTANPTTSYEEDAECFRTWSASELPTVLDLLPSLTDPLEKAMAFSQISFVRACAGAFDKEREQELTYVIDELKKQIAGNLQAELMVKTTEIRFKELVKDTFKDSS